MTFDSRHIPEHLYFVTARTVGWKPLFSETEYAEIVLNSLTPNEGRRVGHCQGENLSYNGSIILTVTDNINS